jgi:TP901 family phage tail tape measure protein
MATQAELTLLLKAKDQASGQIDKVKGKLGGLGGLAGKALKFGLLAGAGGAVALGAGLFKLGADFDKAFDKIEVGTGETGKTLDTLKGDFKKVFKAIPTDMESASDAITQFNTLTGATGPTLQKLAKTGLEAARLLGEDSAALIAAGGKALNVFEIRAEDGAKALDSVFTASQKSNVPMTKLLGTLQTYGPVLKNLGFDLNTSTAFFASLEKAGIDVSRVMPGLNAFMRKLADEGVTDLAGALDDQITKIKEAETSSEALNLATQAFGAEGAQRLSVAIRTGALDLADFSKELALSEGAVLDTARSTESLGEKFTRFKNTLIVGVQPAASAVFDGLGKLATLIETKLVPLLKDKLEPVFKKTIIPTVKDFAKDALPAVRQAAEAILPHLREFADILIEIGREVLPILLDAFNTWRDAWVLIFENVLRPIVLPILEKVGEFLLEHKPLLIAVAAAILLLLNPWLLVVAAIILVLAKWDEIKKMLTVTVPAAIGSVIKKIKEIPVLGAIFEATFETIKVIVTTVFEIIKNRIETTIRVIKDVIAIGLAVIRGDWDEVWNGIKRLVSDILDGIMTEIELVLGGFGALIRTLLDGGLTALGDLAGLFKTAAFDAGAAILSGIKAGIDARLFLVKIALNALISLVERGVNFVIRLINAIPDITLPFGLGTIGIPHIPRVSIPRLQEGAFIPPGVITPAILHGGRRGEIVQPLDRAPVGLRAAPFTLNLTINSRFPPSRGMIQDEVRDAMPEIRRQLQGVLS